MPQYARPEADTLVDNWRNELDTLVTLFNSINEAAFNRATYVVSQEAPSNDVLVVKLGAVTDPVASSGHILSYVYQKNSSGGNNINLTVELRQGYVSEASLGTLIRTITHNSIPSTETQGSVSLTGPECDAITNYGSLYLRFIANQV